METTYMDDTIFLYDEHAESALIGAGFLDPAIFCNGVEASDFGTPGYGVLWRACQRIARDGVTPDLVTLPLDVLIPDKNPIDFMLTCPSVTRADDYASIVRKWERRRRLIDAASSFAKAAYEDSPAAQTRLLQQAHESLAESQSDGKSRLWALTDLLANETPVPEDVVEGFVPGRSAILFSGPGGDGKSYAMLDMAVCVAQGTPWLGLNVYQSPVLIVDLENRLVRVRERMRLVMHGHALTTPPPITFAFSVDSRLDRDEIVSEITHLARRCGAHFVVLDSLADFWGDADENSNSDMAKAAERLRSIAEAIEGSVIGIHHTPKANTQTPRGATALRNGTDVNIMVSRDGKTLVMRQDKNRAGPEVTMAAALNWGNGLFNLSLVGASTGRVRHAPDPDEAAISKVLADGEWVKSSEVIKRVMDITRHKRSTVHNKLAGMISDGMFEKDSQGAGMPYLVRLLDNGDGTLQDD